MLDKSNITVSVVGAGGKMGKRITSNLVKHEYNLLFCEKSEAGISQIQDKGYTVTDTEEAANISDIVILAVPDILIGKISAGVVPLMKSGAILLTLDPAAAYAGQLTVRDDCTSVVAHPCHPSIFAERFTREEHEDAFGGVAAKQDVVIALHHGEEEKLELAEHVVTDMYAPVETCHRITVEQMAILEPTLAETITCMIGTIIKESLEETVKLGVPEAAARAMLLGHIQIALAVTLKGTNPFSDACMTAIELGKEAVIKPDWKKVFTKESLDETITKMLQLDEVNV
ncbi:phosphogluconate dehydrogenase C-terminal domain-containing protein [Bacillus sp. FJAT-50079]|uniref:phosphogluconate dehydrogenase C-terminal domain-containing protein n=1 Tax=Bacillus sp. FJAT-50079 TaxID=2833577 RepID=UPI001BC9E71C|nr:phosphogluconate dehydrogenase C-terminal domain-containing protein [Bacillus sp. FJAT-50079]MBS4208124.1 NAD(P)-binding domain-containing protein [Bacillus sp. FJAT-50079]